jgi:hypothetical protein
MEINRPEILIEVGAVFASYEAALVSNDVEALDRFFWPSSATVRYGAGENLVGIEAIRRFRAERSPSGLARTLRNTVITTFGRNHATAMTEFVRAAFKYDGQLTRIGRQSQTWVRLAEGWRVVAAHVSVLALPIPESLSSPETKPAPNQPEG